MVGKHKFYLSEGEKYSLVSLFVFKRTHIGLNENDMALIRKFGLEIQLER